MASREERMQQRLRGSQRRQVKDVDFGLSFPINPAQAEPNASPSIHQPSPQATDLPPQSTSAQTPAAPQPFLPASVRLSASTNTNDANTSAKRRKLDTDVPPNSARSMRSRSGREPGRGDPPRRLEDIARDAEEGTEEHEQESSDLEPADVELSIGPDLSGEGDGHDRGDPGDASILEDSIDEETIAEVIAEAEVESGEAELSSVGGSRAWTKTPLPLVESFVDVVEESPRNAPGSGMRTRVALPKSSQLLDENVTGPREKTPLMQRKRKRGENGPKSSPILRGRQSQTPVLDELDELSPEQPSSRFHKTRVVVKELDELSPEQPNRRRRTTHAIVDEHAEYTEMDENTSRSYEQEEAEEIDDEQAAAVLTKNQGRRTSSRFAAASPELGAREVSKPPTFKKPKGRLQVDSSPVRQRQPKRAHSKVKSKGAKKAANKQPIRAGKPIDVVVHRLTGWPIYDENEDDADVLNSEIPHVKRSGVNTIDVLSEVCQELISTGLNTLEEMGNECQEKAARREYKVKYDAVETFGREVNLRLLEHTINLDNAYSLERRVRDEQRKKLGLREEILRVRKEREQVALRMDSIRMKHEREKNAAQSRESLNTAVYDIELAIEMGKSAQSQTTPAGAMVGTEVLVKRIANDVSGMGDGGGLLKRIREFNAFLERAALALEERKL
ncbi:hypothetical protein LZ554_004215 [Drepanopeziza brunnea f. sp. 'monogermtubi']|nr:hypothetical protein LZ554_004215 [Drepanopeziza brunnea f. sp. 'monogermtubi']